MMAKKTNTTAWEEYQKASRAGRKKMDDLVAQTEKLAESIETDPVNANRILEEEAPSWEETIEKLRSAVERSRSVLGPRRDAAIEGLADELKRSLEKGGHAVFGESRTMVVDGIVHIDLNLQAGRLKVNGEDHRDLRIENIVTTTSTIVTALKKKISAPAVFGSQLLRAYERLINTTGANFSIQVKTLDLLPVIAIDTQNKKFFQDPKASNYSDYPMSLFRANLHGLLASGTSNIDGCSFRWASGSTTDGAVFMHVPPLQRTAHLGRIWFEKKEEVSDHV
jgi:hypothetical protein